jgi:GntR family transcriptional regulator/MocR family aminotransferase
MMNIPDDAFLLYWSRPCAAGGETLQRTLYQTLREAILQGALAGDSRLPGSRAMAQRLDCRAIPSTARWSSWRWKGIYYVAARGRRGAFRPQGEGDVEARHCAA